MAASVNCDQAALRTALGRVLAPGAPGSEAAWQEPLKPIKNAVKRRTLYLGSGQRTALLQAMDAEAEPFVQALCLLPLRPGAVAALIVAEFDKSTSELTIGKDKAGHNRRTLIPDTAAQLFAAQAQDKLAAAPLFMRGTAVLEQGQPKASDRDAAKKAKLHRCDCVHAAA